MAARLDISFKHPQEAGDGRICMDNLVTADNDTTILQIKGNFTAIIHAKRLADRLWQGYLTLGCYRSSLMNRLHIAAPS
jgi:hypothetical protein